MIRHFRQAASFTLFICNLCFWIAFAAVALWKFELWGVVAIPVSLFMFYFVGEILMGWGSR